MHHKDRPRIDRELCNACRECISICPAGASIDLVNSSLGVAGSEAEAANAMAAGADKFELINPGTDWQMQLKTAEELGLGRREYLLKED